MEFQNGFELDIPRYSGMTEVATEGFLTDFIKNVFPFGFLDGKSKRDRITEFKDMLTDPQNLFGKSPETSPYVFNPGIIRVDNAKGIISIQHINFDLLFKHVRDTYDEKKLTAIFYRTYKDKDIKKFNKKKIGRSQMQITSLISPIFFALELSIMFSQLAKKYRNRNYSLIASTIYKDSWLSKADRARVSPPDISYAESMLNPRFRLKPHQIEFIRAYPEWKAKLNLRGVYNAFDQGLGKTLTAMSLAMSLHVDKVYVVCPNTLVFNWYQEILEYYDGRIVPFDCKMGRPPKDARVFITNNESIRNIYPYIDNSCKSMLIVDEGHNFRNLNSSRVSDLVKLREMLNPSDVLPMSGTPMKATPNELIPAFLLLDPSFTPAAAEMYNRCFNFDNYQAMEIVTARLGKMIYRKMKSDVLELPDKSIEDLRVYIKAPDPFLMENVKSAVYDECLRLIPEVMKSNEYVLTEFLDMVRQYSTAGDFKNRWYLSKISLAANPEKHFSIEEMHEIDVDNVTTFLDTYVISNPQFPSNLANKLKNYESKLIHFDRVVKGRAVGKIYPPRRSAMFCQMWDENEKTFIDMIENNIKKTVIFSQFYPVVTHIKQRLEANGIGVVAVNGTVSNGERAKALAAFKHDDNVRVIIATSQSMGTGVTLIEASQMFFFGPPWRSADYDQCCDRIYRIGQDVDVKIYNVILDTNRMNLSSRMDKILKWSSEMFHAAIDETIVANESAVDSLNLTANLFEEYLI